MDTIPNPTRRRRWPYAAGACAILLVLYVGVLTWASQRLETDVAKAIRPLPVVVEDHQHGD